MEIKIKQKPEKDLSLLAINAAEDLERLNKKMPTELKNAKELSELIKNNFFKRGDYSMHISNAYHTTYSKKISKLSSTEVKHYIQEISNKLENPSKLKKEDLEKLIKFCANLSDYSALYQHEIDSYRIPCFQ